MREQVSSLAAWASSSTHSSKPPQQTHYSVSDEIVLSITPVTNGVATQNPNLAEHWIVTDYDVGTLVSNGANIQLIDPNGNIFVVAGTKLQSNINSDQLAPPTPPATTITLADGLIETSQNPIQLNAPVKILVRPGWKIAVSAFTLKVIIIRVACLLDAAEWLR